MPSPTIDLLEFGIASSRYALRASDVVEIVRAVAITPLPAAPDIVEGVIDLRGQVVPVIDLRARFGHPHRPLDPSQHFVIARAGERLVAIRVDAAQDVTRVNASDIESIAHAVPRARHVAGVVKTADGMVVINDLSGFLTRAEEESLIALLERGETVNR